MPSAVVIAWTSATIVLAAAPAAIEHEDHHQPPPEYAAPGWTLPPAAAEPPEYPGAAAFIPADASNYTPGGISSYQYVVVHTMQGSYEGSINWFQNPSSDVSAHYCARSSDGEITQMVHDADKAWHVGTSNAVALGIEHEGYVEDASWYTWEMYTASAELARWLCDRHQIPVDRDHIVGHVELPNQTHTDPGPNWDWALYMALVRDVVPQGEVVGVVVDGSKACTLTATGATHLTTTLQDAALLADDARCEVAAGDTLRVIHAEPEDDGHRRVHLADADGCAALLGPTDYVVAADWTGWCVSEELAASGAMLQLDGGLAIATAADGTFRIADVAEGAHGLEVSAPGLEATQVAFDQAVYPGTRLVIRLDPPAGGDDGRGGSSGESTSAGDGTDGGSAGGATTGADEATDDAAALPDTFGEQGDGADGGCGCAGGQPRGRDAWLLAAVALLRRRRRA